MNSVTNPSSGQEGDSKNPETAEKGALANRINALSPKERAEFFKVMFNFLLYRKFKVIFHSADSIKLEGPMEPYLRDRLKIIILDSTKRRVRGALGENNLKWEDKHQKIVRRDDKGDALDINAKLVVTLTNLKNLSEKTELLVENGEAFSDKERERKKSSFKTHLETVLRQLEEAKEGREAFMQAYYFFNDSNSISSIKVFGNPSMRADKNLVREVFSFLWATGAQKKGRDEKPAEKGAPSSMHTP